MNKIFQKLIEPFLNYDGDFYVFGLNNDAILIQRLIAAANISIAGFLDNDSRKIDKKYGETFCFNPNKINWKANKNCVILAASSRHEEQREQLIILGQSPLNILFDQAHREKILNDKNSLLAARKLGLSWSLDKSKSGILSPDLPSDLPMVGNLTGQNFDQQTYVLWRKARLRKLISFFSKNNLEIEGKNIVEFGCAYGHVSRHFASRGGIVTACEGNALNFNILWQRLKRYSNISIELHDNDSDWSDKFGYKFFDFCIHWGLLYHLYNWDRDLRLACRCSKTITIDTEVIDSNCPNDFKERKETGLDQSVHGVGRIPSVGAIEAILEEEGMFHIRYDDASLNTGIYKYDWTASNDGEPAKELSGGKRRFWIASTEPINGV